MPTRRFAILMLVLTTAAWGLSFPGGKALLLSANAALPGRDPWFFSSLMIGVRFGLAALLLLLFHSKLLLILFLLLPLLLLLLLLTPP